MKNLPRRGYCRGCARHLPLGAFYVDAHRKGGISADCRECTRRFEKVARQAPWPIPPPAPPPQPVVVKIRPEGRRLRVGRASQRQKVARWDYYGGACWMCGAPASVFDHVKPRARGGTCWPSNLRPACGPCNSRKRARWPFNTAVGGRFKRREL